MKMHTVEKIGGTSMSDYAAVRDNIIRKAASHGNLFQRVFVVSAYGGITNDLLEHKKTGEPGVYALFANAVNDSAWEDGLERLRDKIFAINAMLFDEQALPEANQFIGQRIDDTKQCLADLHRLCQHGHFSLDDHLSTVREMLASLGEAHSAWNTVQLLKRDGINARFIDLTGWRCDDHMSLDERITRAFEGVDLDSELPIVTGYAHSADGLMSTFDRGYSEMTFSRLAVITEAAEAVIHKEFHLSSADPRLVGEANAVPIGRTNYDVADQLANLGMEAIHPKAAKGLRQHNIALRVKNTFEPDHAGTLITRDYVSDEPCVEIIAGCQGVYAIELYDQDMSGNITHYDGEILKLIKRFRGQIVSKDMNANTITHYMSTSLKVVKRIRRELEALFPEAEINQRQVAIVSAFGSDMQVSGLLAKAVTSLAERNINVLSVHQPMRQVDMQFVIDEDDFDRAVKALHAALVEVHDHGAAICLAS